MPTMEHIGNDIWHKLCRSCDKTFEVTGHSFSTAHTKMQQFFAYNEFKSDDLKAHCRSCEACNRHGRNISIHRDEMLKAQDGKCGICEKPISFANRNAYVDHDHKTGQTRKILCMLCNRHMAAIDDEEWLIKGIAYKDSFRD